MDPVVDYLARDYASLRQALLNRLSLTMPAWTEQHLPDVGIALVELLAYAGDLLNYRLDAVGTEAYLGTARLRTSVRRHARLVDYRMHDGCAARAYVTLTVSAAVTLPAGDFRFATADGAVIFEPLVSEDVPLYAEHNEITIWAGGAERYCLPSGATSATLADNGLHLAAGDLLVFEEVLGAVTGLPADADPTHRQVVRLTTVTPGTDAGQDVLTVTWDRADALGFPLCVAAKGRPDCADLVVGVARGNVVLAEHGASTDWCGGAAEQPAWPAAPAPAYGCPPPCAWGCPADGTVPLPAYPPVPFRPYAAVAKSPVTQHAPYPDPRQLGPGQARALATIPATARENIEKLSSQGTGLDDSATGYLRTLFGADVMAAYGLAAGSGQAAVTAALHLLLDRFDVLLDGKLSRLAQLARRARAGRLLTADEGTELDWAWGAGTGQLIDPDRAVFRGPASAALRSDPRDALPDISATVAAPVGPAAPASPAVADVTGAAWRPRRDLLGCGPTDRYFVGETDDNQVLTLRFGDGRAGLAPPPGATVDVRYRVGNGTPGNVGAEAITTVTFCATHTDAIKAVRNPLAARGGTDPEPVTLAKQRAPSVFDQVLRRAITAADYAEVAGRHPDVQRAGAQLRWTGSWYEAQVAIDASGTETAPGWLLDDEVRLLHRYRRIGHDVRVSTGTLVPVELAVCVQVRPGYIADDVRAAVLSVLGDGVAADGTLEMFHPDNLTFGTPVRVSAIVAAVTAVPGVLGVAVTRLKRQFAPDEGALAAGLLTFAPDEIPQLDNDPAHPDHGVLRLTIGGGR